MAGYKETPRQKMIGMMYLVLTALLALNVSKQILDAFVVVNESMEKTNTNFGTKLENTHAKFKVQYQLNPNKVGPYYEKAQQAQKYSADLIHYVDSLKWMVLKETERLETLADAKKLKLSEAARKDNFDVPTNFFIGGSHDGSTGRAKDLRDKIEQYRKNMLDLLDPKYRETMNIGLETAGPYYDANGVKQNWQMHNFYHTILAATVTILNEIKAEVLNAEFDIVNNLYSSVSAEDWKFDEIRAKVIPKSSYVFLGEQYEAEILVAAYDTKQNPMVRYLFGADTMSPGSYTQGVALEGSNGVVTITLPGSGEGLKRFAGIIKVVSPLGDTMSFHFKDDFIVARPALTISPTKMNVFYVGVDNPVAISVPGGPERVVPSVSVGKIRADGANWVVYDLPPPTTAREAVINVSAVFSGKPKSMGTMSFRLKRVPDPIATVGGKSEGVISKSLILASPFLVAAMPPGFDFDLKFSVVAYTFTTEVSGDIIETRVQGNRLTPEIIKSIQNAKKNKRVWFEDISVRGPDGERTIKSINLKIN